MQNTYTTAVEVCFSIPRKQLMSDLQVGDDVERIARAYSTVSRVGVHREASYTGCLEGLMTPGAGNKQQFAP